MIEIHNMQKYEIVETEREGEILSKINHPNIVSFIEQIRDDEKQEIYLVMDFATGMYPVNHRLLLV